MTLLLNFARDQAYRGIRVIPPLDTVIIEFLCSLVDRIHT